MADTPQTPSPGPQAGDPNARKGVEGNVHGHADNPMGQLWMAMSGASAGEHHEEVPGVNPKSAQVGHEPDQFPARTIVYVPVIVAVTLVATYLIVQTIFSFVNGKESRQDVEVAGAPAAENATRVKAPNDRVSRIRTTTADPLEPAAAGEKTLPPVPQPNLEYMQNKNYTRRGANGETYTDPPFVRSAPRTGDNNSPEIYPEDLRPGGRYGTPAEAAWVPGHEGKLAVLPVDEMIELVAGHDKDAKYKDVLKVADKPATKPAGSLGKPKISSGGQTPPKGQEPKAHDAHGHE